MCRPVAAMCKYLKDIYEFRVRDAGKIFENIKAVPQHSSESQ